MTRLRLILVIGSLTLAATTIRAFAAEDESCQKPYVVPYAEQCSFAYRSLKKDTSPPNLSAAFAACGRAQNVAVSCVKSPDRRLHAIALGALFQDVTQQAEIAVFAQQFAIATALLREKLQIIGVVAHDAKPGDRTIATERDAAKIELADATAGLCTQTVLAGASDQRQLAKDRKFAELAALLKRKSNNYASCALQAPTRSKRAYLAYVGIVALEESARASQAAGSASDAEMGYRACVSDAERISTYAKSPVTGYLKTIAALCTGRHDGRYAVDQPTPIDQSDAKGFKPLVLPKS
jgi:hypothetical protein